MLLVQGAEGQSENYLGSLKNLFSNKGFLILMITYGRDLLVYIYFNCSLCVHDHMLLVLSSSCYKRYFVYFSFLSS